ncbi:MAG: MBL fold metallo-hydrolase [Chloroflexota bacterium]
MHSEPGTSTSLQPSLICPEPPVYMVTCPNPGPKTLDGTNTYAVIGDDRRGYVIDPGPGNLTYQHALAGWIEQAGIAVRAILLTHKHPDHADGAEALATLVNAPVLATQQQHENDVHHRFVDGSIVPGDKLPLDDGKRGLLAIATPGHTPDHLAFYQPDAGIVFTGDLILGDGSTLVAPPEGDVRVYLESLHHLAALDLRTLAPGHGPVSLHPYDKIQENVLHREERERQILAALRATPATVEEIVIRVYADVDPAVRSLAAGSVQAHLIKLLAESKIEKHAETYRECGGER